MIDDLVSLYREHPSLFIKMMTTYLLISERTSVAIGMIGDRLCLLVDVHKKGLYEYVREPSHIDMDTSVVYRLIEVEGDVRLLRSIEIVQYDSSIDASVMEELMRKYPPYTRSSLLPISLHDVDVLTHA